MTLTWLVGNEPLRSQHKVYTIAGNLDSGNNFHTVIDLSCNAAKGLTKYDKDEIYRRLWNRFATLDIRRIDSIGNNDVLTYWGTGAEYTYNISDVLQRKTARCGTWSLLFREACALQGVNVGFVVIVPKSSAISLIQTASSFQGDSSVNGMFFADHEINVYSNKYYDVTCGAGPYNSVEEYLVHNVSVRICTGSFEDGNGNTVYTYVIRPLTYLNINDYIIYSEVD